MFKRKQKNLDKAYEKALKIFVKNKKKGVNRLIKLSRKGSSKAALFLRKCLLNNMYKFSNEWETARAFGAANNLLRKAADNGDVDSQYEVAKMFETGQGFQKNEQAAFQYFLMAAKNGEAKAQTNVSRYYTLGIGVEHNAKEAIYWKQQAANQGETIAMINIANSYENGKGLPKDNNQAIAWYKKALETAKYLLDTEGKGMREYSEKNEKNAMDLATKGLRRMEIQIACEEYRSLGSDYLRELALKKIEAYANEGEWRAQFEMGLICENEKDYVGAIKWYEVASNNGSSGGMRNIGLIYYYGKGVNRSYELAYKWFKKAVDYAANTYAMYMLGEMYEKGLYVGKDTETALSWYRKADMQGSPDANKKIKELSGCK